MINVDLFYVLIYHPHNLFDGVPAQIFAYFYWVVSPLFNFENFIYMYIYVYMYIYICIYMYVCMYVFWTQVLYQIHGFQICCP